MTLKEYFLKSGIDLKFIKESFEGKYGAKVYTFVQDAWNKEIESLPLVQFMWACSIRDDCFEIMEGRNDHPAHKH